MRVLSRVLGLQLIESYRLLIDSANAMGSDPVQARPETLERMLQAASYGAQALDAAAKRVASDIPPEAREREGDVKEGVGNVVQVRSTCSYHRRLVYESATVASQKTEGHPTEGQTCLGCNATSTPEWRRGPMGTFSHSQTTPSLTDAAIPLQGLERCVTRAVLSMLNW